MTAHYILPFPSKKPLDTVSNVMSRVSAKMFVTIFLGFLVLSLASACSVTRKTTQSSRTAVEQLLLTEATERSFAHQDLPPLPIPEGAAVSLDVTALTTWSHKFDTDFFKQIIAGWLGEQGFLIRDSRENAAFRLEVVTNALGTEFSQTFIGMPEFQSVLIPFALPELALFKAQYQTGFARFYVNIFENATDRFMGATPVYTGETYHNIYTVLLVLGFSSSNLTKSPQLGTLHDPVDSGQEPPLHTTTIDGQEPN